MAGTSSDQRNAVLAGFLGWTLDAFDFFVLTFVIDDVARSFGRSRVDIALALTLALSTRPIGAIVFGIMADRFGRRLPLMINVIMYAVLSVLSGLAPSYGLFLLWRMLFGVAMGGEWGVGASLALESVSPRWRGFFSGMLQQGYALGNILAAIVFRLAYPHFAAVWGPNGWRALFFIGGLPALLSIFIRAKVKEPEAWTESRTDWPTYRRTIVAQWRRFLYLVVLMMMMNFMSHGTQDMYPTLLKSIGYTPQGIANLTVLAGIGAILGGITFGHYSDRAGRRRSLMIAAACALIVVPFWIAGHDTFRIVIGVFLMQFFVQGAWGVIPAHINELSPGQCRGFFPGFAYQLGVLCAAGIPSVESALGERFTYTQAMGGLMTAVFVVAVIVMWAGPEAKGVAFRRADLTSH